MEPKPEKSCDKCGANVEIYVEISEIPAVICGDCACEVLQKVCELNYATSELVFDILHNQA